MSAYTQYYTASDCTVFLEHPSNGRVIQLDKMSGIGFTESLSSTPYYGVGNSKFGFLSRGNLIVEGVLQLNFTNQRYLFNAIQYIFGSSSVEVNPDVMTSKSFAALSNDSIKSVKSKRLQETLASKGIHQYSSGFNVKIVFNNGFLYHTDQNKTIRIKGVKIVASDLMASTDNDDAQILKVYRFLAREINQ